jgi:hypothetical protein
VVTEHLEDNDELLLHLLTADLRRYAIEAFQAGPSGCAPEAAGRGQPRSAKRN